MFDTLKNASILVGSALVLYHSYQAFNSLSLVIRPSGYVKREEGQGEEATHRNRKRIWARPHVSSSRLMRLLGYAQTHPDEHLTEPQFSNYYTPSKEQRTGEMLFTGVTVAGLAYGISRLV